MDRRFLGLVIAGGRSTRMGRDKATLFVAGAPLLTRASEALSGAVAKVAVCAPPGGPAARLAASLGLPCIEDPPGAPAGPLAGVLAGLRWARRLGAEGLVTLPCDAPLLPADLPQRLAMALEHGPCSVARSPGGVESLCAGWRVELEPKVAEPLEAGHHPPIWRLLSDLGCAFIDYPSVEAFLNINTPEDAALAAATLSSLEDRA